MRKVEIFPSILSADFAHLKHEIEVVDQGGADGIHLDVMDGHYVPNISFGPVVLKWIRKASRLPYFAHLMISDPEKYIQDYIDIGADGIFVHPETQQDMIGLSRQMKSQRVTAGIALNPETSVNEVEDILPFFEEILILTVYPGFGGQKLLPDNLEKVTEIKARSGEWGVKHRIHVDGGVYPHTAEQVIAAGTDVLIAGSAVFAEPDRARAIRNLRTAGECAL